ncbi:MAG: hypothetical protein HC818_01175 [Synechococcaceae cyanobacterium RM1_1_27]|nr:hypothetical protein [Synechococcaceae cyanobacterium SM2_3_2]NJO85468.1 hypothetical protein [Synechococcaceae cyanobacterium RM1_1_27]
MPPMNQLDRPKWVAVVTGILAIAVSVGYLILVQLIDYRGSFEPAPVGMMLRISRAAATGISSLG